MNFNSGNIFIGIALAMLFSCREEVVIVPANILHQDSLAAVLVDLQIVEAMKVKKGINDSTMKDSLLLEYSRILKKHNLTKEQFEESFTFYKTNPELLEEIFDRTISELSRKQAMVGSVNKVVMDSIKKSKEVPFTHKIARDAAVLKAEKEKNDAKKKSSLRPKTSSDTLPAKKKK